MIKLTVPVYYKDIKATKASKTIFVAMNWYNKANCHESNKVKQHYHKLVKKELEGVELCFDAQYRAKYTYYYKNCCSDLMNVCAVIDKFVQDGLQENGTVVDDNVQYYTRAVCEVGGQDKKNPRVEIILEERNI